MDKLELEKLIDGIARVFNIGRECRTASVFLENIKNAHRRSSCLRRVERVLEKVVISEDGESYEECPLGWGDSPNVYEEKFKVWNRRASTTREASLQKEVERLKAREWQPIDTAPTELFKFFLVGRKEGEGSIPAVAIVTRIGDKFEVVGMGEFKIPTHWMPLPESPSTGETQCVK